MTAERQAQVLSGWTMLPITIVLYIVGPLLLVLSFTAGAKDAAGNSQLVVWMLVVGLVALGLAILSSLGYFTLQPNEARLLILFGDYRGTTRQGGFRWANPFYANGPAGQGTLRGFGSTGTDSGGVQASRQLPRYKVSLRARTLNGDRLKVNDRAGNPVEIATVVVWHVHEPRKRVRRRRLRGLRGHAKRDGAPPSRHGYAYDEGEGRERDHPARQRRCGLRRAQARNCTSALKRPACASRRPG